MGAGVFATGGAVLFAACGALVVVTLGLGTAAGAGREVSDGGDVTAGCGVRDAVGAGGGDGAMCPRPAQAFSPKIAAAIIQICAADISIPFPPILRMPVLLASFGSWSFYFRRRNLRTIAPAVAGTSFFAPEPAYLAVREYRLRFHRPERRLKSLNLRVRDLTTTGGAGMQLQSTFQKPLKKRSMRVPHARPFGIARD